MTDTYRPAQPAAEIAAARDRQLAFAAICTDDDWNAEALSDQGDPRPVGVIVDHVADAYDYLGNWIAAIIAGEDPQVKAQLVDELNAGHAAAAGSITQAGAMEHLQASGDAIVALVGELADSDLDLAGGRVTRLAEVATRHADDHRAAIEAALGHD